MSGLYRWVAQHTQRKAAATHRLHRLPALQYLLHCMDASYDLVQYLRFFTPLHTRAKERRRLQALIFLYYHRIEKALALPERADLFGTSYLGTLLDLLDLWVQSTGDVQAVVFRGAYGALRAYRSWAGKRLEQEFPALSERLDWLLATFAETMTGQEEGGTRQLTATVFQGTVDKIDFEQLVRMRHSVRNFSARPVPEQVISRAVRIAQHSPSVCNRQACRVHVYTSPEDKKRVLLVQNGNSGFGYLAAHILLISAEISAFVTSSERHQAHIDAGMFAMTLVYALQAQGIVSCCLNLSRYCFQDIAVHRVCRIPAWELPIMMIAIGYPPTEFEITLSARLPIEAVLSWRNLRE
jgi:nitroreductase